jgi:Relaxase/Mobilisation nuclease domain
MSFSTEAVKCRAADQVAAKRLDKRQAVHMIFSVSSHAQADAERLGRAVSLALGETVREGGFRYVWTIHTDHSARRHAHIVVKARSERFQKDGVEKTRQLRLGPKELDAMRQVFTRHTQERGLNVIATRRQDREHLSADILAGQAPLCDNMKFHQWMKQTRQGRTSAREGRRELSGDVEGGTAPRPMGGSEAPASLQ